jgi:hypothetical protein
VHVGHRLVIPALGAVLVLAGAGCSGGADDPPVASPPPAVELEVPDHAWLPTTVPPIVGGMLKDVAGNGRGFVAVGSVQDANGDVIRGLALFSEDGVDWVAPTIDGLERVDLNDVAAGPDGFVIIGERILGPDRRLAVIATSADGMTWEQPAIPDPDRPTYAFRVDWAGDRYVVIATDLAPGGGAIELSSPDGLTWVSAPVPYQRRVVPTGAGWLGIGPMETWTTLDGAPFESGPVPPDDHGHRADEGTTAVVSPAGTLLVGFADSPCGPLSSSCGLESAAWWSTDAASWAAVPHGTPGWPFRYAWVTSDGSGLAVAYQDRQAWASNDGWRWVRLASAEAPGEGVANGIAATPGRLVAVGESILADGTIVPWIGTAAAP